MIENFKKTLEGLNNDPRKLQAIKIIMSKFEEKAAVDTKFYRPDSKFKRLAVQNNLFELIDATDPYLETLIKLEAATAYSIFSYILREDFSDIMFYSNGFNLSDNKGVHREILDDDLVPLYQIFIDHFVQNIMFLSSKKFDAANSILDAEIGSLRFNMIYRDLNANEKRPIIVIRKQTVKKEGGFYLSDEYLDTLGISQKQKDVIQKYAVKGNVIIFGEVGSGKTTLLRYMGNYKLEEKRNLCIIEDTKELGIDVPISLLTNHRYKIKDLFVAALRQNPSSIIIGETRTSEIVDILESALTISVGTTIHANSFTRAIQRICFMSIEREIKTEEIKDLINASVDCFIYMKNRKVEEIWEHKQGIFTNIFEAYEKVE